MFHDIELDARGETDEDYRNTIWVSGAEEVCNYWDVLDETYCHISGWEQASKLHLYKIDVSDTYNLGSSTGGEEENNLALNLTNQLEFNYRMAIEHVMDGSTPTLYAFYTQLVESNYGTTPTMTKKDMIVEKSIDNGSTFTPHYSVLRTNNEDIIINPAVFRVSNDGKRMYFESGKSPQTSGRHVRRVTWNNTSSEWDSENDNWWYNPTPTNNTHADIRDIVVWKYDDSGLEDKIFVAHDGGLSYSESLNGSNKHVWELKNGTGLNNSEFFTVSTQIDDKDVSYLSGQDNGAFIFRGLNPTLPTWEHIEGGDGYELVYNQNQPSIDNYHYNQTEESYYSPYNGISDGGVRTIHPTRMMVDESNFIYFGHQEVMKYDFDVASNVGWNSGFTNTQLSNFTSEFGTSEELQVAHVAKYRPDIIYAAKLGTTNDGADLSGVLFKCTNCDDPNSREWEDIGSSMAQPLNGPFNTAIAWSGVFDITTDPNNPDKVWVSFDGFREDRKIRVLYSDDGGDTWTDYSVGLPAVGVSRIIYQEGSNDLLYAGTDIGVYYRDASMTDLSGGWQCFSNDLPICLVSDLEIDYCERKLYASTFGRGAWITDLIDDNTNNERVINSNTTWNDPMRIVENVVRIESGVTLSVKDDLRMPKGGRIIVEDGAKLLVDGGTITNACGYMWQGIEVWGDPNESADATLPSAQGIVELKNGAVIENAIVGVYLGISGDCCSHSGGIILSDGGSTQDDRVVFKNNRKHVAMMRYTRQSLSHFTNTDFICDGLLNDQENFEGLGTGEFVSIWDQKRIVFKDCLFKNHITYTDPDGDPGSFGPWERGTGIVAIDAQYDVESTGTASASSESSLDVTRFIGLDVGIDNRNLSYGHKRMAVTNSYFDNCWRGIATLGGSVDRVTDSFFRIRNGYSSPGVGVNAATTVGIQTFFTRGYKLEGNKFEGLYGPSDPDPEDSYGTVSSAGFNDVYSGGVVHDNEYKSLETCTQSEWFNPNLRISCNEYTDGTYDWMINPEVPGFFPNQGTNCNIITGTRAGNVFNDAGNHIWSIGATDTWTYFGNASESGQAPTGSGNVSVNDCINIFLGEDESCDPSSGGGGDPTETHRVRKLELDSLISDRMAAYDTIFDNLDSLNTDTLLAHVADTTYNKDSLATELAYNSPLSDTVLKATILRNQSLNDDQLIEVFVPNSPVSPSISADFYAKLETMSDAVNDTLVPIQGDNPNFTTLTAVQREIDTYKAEWTIAVNEITSLYASDSSFSDLASYLEDSIATNESRKVLIGTYMQLDSLSSARSALDSIVLSTNEDSAFYTYYDIMLDLREDTLSWFDMDSTQNAKILELADGDFDVAIHAQNVLVLTTDSIYMKHPEIYTPPSPRMSANDSEEPIMDNGLESLNIYPNPFKQQFTVEYVFEEEVAELIVEVYDLQGRTLITELRKEVTTGTLRVDLSCCAEGTYVCKVMADRNLVETQRIIHSR